MTGGPSGVLKDNEGTVNSYALGYKENVLVKTIKKECQPICNFFLAVFGTYTYYELQHITPKNSINFSNLLSALKVSDYPFSGSIDKCKL